MDPSSLPLLTLAAIVWTAVLLRRHPRTRAVVVAAIAVGGLGAWWSGAALPIPPVLAEPLAFLAFLLIAAHCLLAIVEFWRSDDRDGNGSPRDLERDDPPDRFRERPGKVGK
jgi:apolipoprotein N-acyltransferase